MTRPQATNGSNGSISSDETTKKQESVSTENTMQDVDLANRPGRVSKVKAKNLKGKKVKLTWKKTKNASGYQIVYAANKKFKKNKRTVNIANVKKIKRTIRKLQYKKTYYFKIRAYKKVSGQKVYGKWSKRKKVKIKK